MSGRPDHRRSLRLQGYDYAQAGAYFVTLCMQDRICLFGEIIDERMRLNAAGGKWFDGCGRKSRGMPPMWMSMRLW